MAKPKFPVVAESFNVTVDQQWLGRIIEQTVTSSIAAHVESAVEKCVAEHVAAMVESVGKAEVLAAVKAVLAEGWRKTNSYGESMSCTLTLKDRIGEILNAKERYGSDKPWIAETVRDTAKHVIEKDLKADIDKARSDLKAQVNGALTMVIKKAMADQLGLKVPDSL